MKAGDVLEGRYRLEVRDGQGGVAWLWRAQDLYEDRIVAVKVMKSHEELSAWLDPEQPYATERELVKRFRREGSLLAELHHPHIPELFGQGVHHGRPFLVMRYVKGASLYQLQERHRPLPLSAVAAVMVPVADALACAHRAGVIHRDIKPRNIVLAEDGTVFLIDFGIALPTDPGATRYTLPGATPGSPGYTAPEQLLGDRVTDRADVYSLGCVCFEMQAGRRPFVPHSGELGVDAQHIRCLAPALASLAPDTPDDLADVVDAMLAKEPGQRPPGAEAVLSVFRRYLPRPGDPAPEPRLNPDPTAPYRRSPQAGVVTAVGSPVRVSRAGVPRRPRFWLGRGMAEAALAAAERELSKEGPGPHAAELNGLLPQAVSEWGLHTPLTARIQLCCADAAMADGETERPAKLFRELVEELGHSAVPAIRQVALSARLGTASCLLPHGDIPAAFARWAAVVEETAWLVEPPPEVVRRCRELGLELAELGRPEDVAELLRLLPTVP